MKFLIVDDSPAMQAIILRSLERSGYSDLEFRKASDGNEAIDIMRDWEPDLVFTDWHMPGMNGLQLIRECGRQMLGIKIGLVTTETSPDMIQEARDAGAVFVLHKPFELDEFRQVLVPIIQGAVEGEALLEGVGDQDKTGYELHMPSIRTLSKIIDGMTLADVKIELTDTCKIDYKYLPYVVALFSDHDQSVIKAVGILDIRAAAILACGVNAEDKKLYKQCVTSKELGRNQLDNVSRVMKMISAMFYDPGNKQDLDLKSVHLIPKPFERLDKMGDNKSDKRLDLKISAKAYGEGHMILMEVLE